MTDDTTARREPASSWFDPLVIQKAIDNTTPRAREGLNLISVDLGVNYDVTVIAEPLEGGGWPIIEEQMHHHEVSRETSSPDHARKRP